MDPESNKLLEETFNLVKENNEMLRKVRSVQKWTTFWSGLKVFLIIGIALGSFYFLEPYLNKVVNLYNSIYGTKQSSTNSGSSLQDILRKVIN